MKTRKILDTLCSPNMHGRGYVKNGERIAAEFISSEFKKSWLKSFLFETYLQPFPVSVNTFPGKMYFSAGDSVLTPGKDFLVMPFSGSIKKKSFKIIFLNKDVVSVESAFAKFKLQDFSEVFLILDKSGVSDSSRLEIFEEMLQNPLKAKGIIVLSEAKLTHGLASREVNYPVLEVLKSALPLSFKKICVEVENVFFEKYFTQNVIGYVEGTQFPDSFLVFSAHYDHLGRMGNAACFPGANDNASGTAMLLRLSEYFAKNPQKMSIAFIAFGAEEAGLVGSKYFTLHPLFPLKKIRFLTNLDILGTGDEGIMVVNATEYPKEFENLKKINSENKFLSDIRERGKAKNSDHYFFSEMGVPSFFIYTLGGTKAYHDIYDKAENLPLTEFEDISKLLIIFSEFLQNTN